jgi:hypothetical protein
MDYHYCTSLLLSLAVYIEILLGTAGQGGCLTPYVFGFSEHVTVPAGGEKTKDKVLPVQQSILHDQLFCHEEFNDGAGGLLLEGATAIEN